MASVINTNVMSLNAQRNLSSSQNSLKTSLERLSSGLRINSAKDDAAGLAIADRMTTQIRGMNQAVRNANDAISLAQTGEGALKQVTSNLQRMRELAVQSANATNTDSDRQSLNDEFQELLAENDRLAETTSFNGKKVLDGTMQSAAFQVGANVGETITVDVSSSMRTNAIGKYATTDYTLNGSTAAGADAAAIATAMQAGGASDSASLNVDGDLQINGTNIAGITTEETAGRGYDSAYAIAKQINLSTDQHGITATANATEKTFTTGQVGGFAVNDTVPLSGDTLSYTLTINDKEVFSQTSTTAKTVDQLASDINAVKDDTGVSASVDDAGQLTLTAADGRNIEIVEELAGGSEAADSITGYFGNTLTGDGSQNTEAAGTFVKGSISLSGNRSIEMTDADANSDKFFQEIAIGGSKTTDTSTLDQSNILNVANAESAIYRIDQAISDVDVFRGTFGAIQSRFESTISSLQTTVENVSAARSRIQDADFAAETAELTRNQILQQAGTAMLAQANQAPQSVLSLLQ